MARTARPSKPSATELTVPLAPEDATYAKRFLRVDATRCLALGNRSARWLEGDEPGALLDLGGGYYGSGPYLLPDGRVVLAGLDGLAVLDGPTVTTFAYAFASPFHGLPSGISAGRLLLTSVSDGVAVWMDLDGREHTRIEAREQGVVIAGGDTVYALHHRDGALHMERHDGVAVARGWVPWEAECEGPFFREVPITGASAHGDRLVVVHNALTAFARWRGDNASRVTTDRRVLDARVGRSHTAVRLAGTPPSIAALDDAGALRWRHDDARFTNVQVVGQQVLSMARKCETVLVVDAVTGDAWFRGALSLARADDAYEGSALDFDGGLVLCPARLNDPQKCAWLLTPGREPQKLAHEGLGGAVPWGDASFATWAHTVGEASVSVKRWKV